MPTGARVRGAAAHRARSSGACAMSKKCIPGTPLGVAPARTVLNSQDGGAARPEGIGASGITSKNQRKHASEGKRLRLRRKKGTKGKRKAHQENKGTKCERARRGPHRASGASGASGATARVAGSAGGARRPPSNVRQRPPPRARRPRQARRRRYAPRPPCIVGSRPGARVASGPSQRRGAAWGRGRWALGESLERCPAIPRPRLTSESLYGRIEKVL